MNNKEILKKARNLLSDPEDWTQGVYIKDDCMCAKGAIVKAIEPHRKGYWNTSVIFDEKIERICRSMVVPSGRGRVVYFNDQRETTHEDILKMFDRSIRMNIFDRMRKAYYDIRGIFF